MRKGGIVCIILLLFVGFSITPAMGGILKANVKTEELVTIDFFDSTGSITVKTSMDLPKSEWIALQNELKTIKKSSTSIEESISSQITVFKKYNLISEDANYENLIGRALEKSKKVSLKGFLNRIRTTPIINNSLFSVMCAIDFVLTNGTTVVLGLNTFINYIGFDIFSIHKGYAEDGIDTKGINPKSTPPGDYIGFMFGFLGYWLGDSTIPGFYSNVTVAGFTVITGWLPIPLFP
jgi:hypothetical protein